jgi:hypothetical protein
LYIGFTPVPIISVESRFSFAAKIILVVVLANCLGAFIYWFGKGRTLDAASAQTEAAD